MVYWFKALNSLNYLSILSIVFTSINIIKEHIIVIFAMFKGKNYISNNNNNLILIIFVKIVISQLYRPMTLFYFFFIIIKEIYNLYTS